MATKKPVKKTKRVRNMTATEAYIDNIWAEAFWRAFESIKHTAPAYEPDIEFLDNLIIARLAVVEAEKEKEAERIKKLPYYNWWTMNTEEPQRSKDISDLQINSEWYSMWYINGKYVNVHKKELKEQKTRRKSYLIRSILLSLLVGYTASFIIN